MGEIEDEFYLCWHKYDYQIRGADSGIADAPQCGVDVVAASGCGEDDSCFPISHDFRESGQSGGADFTVFLLVEAGQRVFNLGGGWNGGGAGNLLCGLDKVFRGRGNGGVDARTLAWNSTTLGGGADWISHSVVISDEFLVDVRSVGSVWLRAYLDFGIDALNSVVTFEQRLEMIKNLKANKICWLLIAGLALVAALSGVFYPAVYRDVVAAGDNCAGYNQYCRWLGAFKTALSSNCRCGRVGVLYDFGACFLDSSRA